MSITTERPRVATTRSAPDRLHGLDRRRRTRPGQVARMERAARVDAYEADVDAYETGVDGHTTERIGFWQAVAGVLLCALVILGLVGLANLRAASLETSSAPVSTSEIGIIALASAPPN